MVYAVPGSPLVAERTVDLLRADGRVDVTALPALSFLDLAWAALGIDPLAEGVRLADAGVFGPALARQGGPFLVAQCWSRHLLSEVKLALPDDEGLELPRPVLLHHLGLEDEVVAAVDWWELDRTLEPDHLTSLYVPAYVPPASQRRAGDGDGRAGRAHGHAARALPVGLGPDPCLAHAPPRRGELRGPGRAGGPRRGSEGWTAEAPVATTARTPTRTCRRSWGTCSSRSSSTPAWPTKRVSSTWPTWPAGVHDKLVHRHPHVFGDVDADTAEQVVTNWEAIKKSEKGRRSVTEGIPAGLPALMLTTKLARKARAVGVGPGDEPDGPGGRHAGRA